MTIPAANRPECADCGEPPQPHYDHVHWVDELPRKRHVEDHIRNHGYAVGMSGTLPQTWIFFDDRAPALVFGRAARMSAAIRSYGVYPAAHEVRWNEHLNRDVFTLYLRQNEGIDRRPDERKDFQRWLDGVDPESSHFRPRR